MVFYHFARILSIAFTFIYPAYGSYKALSRRPAAYEQQQAQEQQKERWLMYWSVLAFVMSAEYAGEWLVSWFPGYWLVKAVFLIWLVAPQTEGSTFIFKAYLAPYLSKHEGEIDAHLLELNSSFLTFFQQKIADIIAAVTGHASAAASGSQYGQPQSQSSASGANNLNAGGLATGAAQAAMGLWKHYAAATPAGTQRPEQTRATSSYNSVPSTLSAATGYNVNPSFTESHASLNSRTAPTSADPYQQGFAASSTGHLQPQDGAPGFPVPEIPDALRAGNRSRSPSPSFQ